MKRLLILPTLLALLVIATACSTDDPVKPDPQPEPAPVATSPDSLMSIFGIALAEMDADLYANLLGTDAEVKFDPWYVGNAGLLTDHLNREESVLAVGNMMSGESVTNWRGELVPPVARITIYQWDLVSEWTASKGDKDDPPVDTEQTSLWKLRFLVERGQEYSVLLVDALYRVTVELLPAMGPLPVWVLTDLEPLEDGKSERFDWAAACLFYMTNEPPVAEFTVTEEPGVPWPSYTFDPTLSTGYDPELEVLPFRWRLGNDAVWTEWSAGTIQHVFESDKPQLVTLEVRDRWGATDRVEKAVTPRVDPLPFPGSPTQLMKNFLDTYETMRFDEYRRLLHPDFVTVLQQETIDQFPDVGTTLDVDEELRIHNRMFSGQDLEDPVTGALVPGVEGITYREFRQLDDWLPVPLADPVLGDLFAPFQVDLLVDRGQEHTRISIQGQIRFYVAATDSLHEGVVQDYYRMSGQVDLTGFNKATESGSWGAFKALYR